MKKTIVLSALIISSLWMGAQETNTWRIGLQSGWQINRSKYVGGMSDANARFHKNPFGAVAFDLIGRYDFNNRWMIQSGLNFNNAGFEFALAENYSFLNFGKDRFTTVKSNVAVLEIPVMISYKFKPNCANWKWFVSGGVANVFVAQQNINSVYTRANDGPASTTYLSSNTVSKGGNYLNARFMIGKEKVFKTGSILQGAFIWNMGFSEIAHTTVNYTVDGKTYSHEFSNRGSFVGFRIAYFFRPLHNPWKNEASKKKTTSLQNAAN